MLQYVYARRGTLYFCEQTGKCKAILSRGAKVLLEMTDTILELQLIDFIRRIISTAKLVANAKSISEMRGDAYVGNDKGS